MKFKLSIYALLIPLILIGCTKGGDDNSDSPDSPGLSQNACSALGLGSRIISGTECSENNSPVVEINLQLGGGRFGTCSGSMLTNEWVLTAAHCFFENPTAVQVSASGVSAAGALVRIHPDLKVDEDAGAVFHDIALIKLASKVTLPTLPIVGSRAPVSGDVIKIYGYGQTEDESSSNNTVGTLRSGEMSISSSDANFVDALYGGDGSNTCSGDSGGPAVLDVNGQLGIVGVLSTGSLLNCEVGDVSRFGNVQGSSNLNFITSVVQGVNVI